LEGAQISARIRSYLSTCQKHAIHATEALDALFHGRLPEIIARLE
jgi:transposase